MEVRVAHRSDVPMMREVYRRAALSNEGDRAALLAHPDALHLADDVADDGRATVLTLDGTVVGFASVRPTSPGALELDDLFVEPARMRQGVARALVGDIVTRARSTGIRRIEVDANPHALPFYRAVGFRSDGRVRTELGSGWRMHLDVDAVGPDGSGLVGSRSLPGQATLLASWRGLATESPRATVLDTAATATAVFPHWLPLNNAVLHGRPSSASAAAAAADLAGVYAAAGVEAWALWLPSTRLSLDEPDEVTEVAGLRRDTSTLVMTLDLDAAPAGVDLGDAVDPDVTATTVALAARETPYPAQDLESPSPSQPLDAWALVQDGQVVAGAWSLLAGTDCGIYAVETAAAWRRRGLAGRLMRTMLADARRRGARTASLQSTPMGVPLYRSVGFTPAGRYDEWVPVRS